MKCEIDKFLSEKGGFKREDTIQRLGKRWTDFRKSFQSPFQIKSYQIIPTILSEITHIFIM